jgi:hypothetical protein
VGWVVLNVAVAGVGFQGISADFGARSVYSFPLVRVMEEMHTQKYQVWLCTEKSLCSENIIYVNILKVFSAGDPSIIPLKISFPLTCT